MTDEQIVKDYFDAWDRHDLDAIAATFNAGGSYADPTTDGKLQGQEIIGYAEMLFEAFPDLSLELISVKAASNGVIAAPWFLFGTLQGELMGSPPTHKKVTLSGCDFIVTSNGRIDSVTGLFDPTDFMRQLELESA